MTAALGLSVRGAVDPHPRRTRPPPFLHAVPPWVADRAGCHELIRSIIIPDPAAHPTVPVWPVVGMAFGKKRSAILELARQGKLPVRVFRIGGSYRVATAELLRVLGQDP